MMKRTKKILLPILTAALLMSGLTACGNPVGMIADMAESSYDKNHPEEKDILSSRSNDEDDYDEADYKEDDNNDHSKSKSSYDTDDVTLWINGTYAVLTYLNGWDYMIYAGVEYDEDTEFLYQYSLEEWWGVEDRETADETLDWVLNEGHREGFVSLMEQFADEGIEDIDPEDREDYFYEEYYDISTDEAKFLAEMYGYYEEYGPEAIDAWDYSRAVYLPSMYYLAGYYTEDEAKEKSLEIAKMIQNQFTSWDDFMESYFRGYEYWAEESSDDRRKAYEEIKSDPYGPYSLDWNMELSY